VLKNTKILSVGIKYSVLDLLFDVSNYDRMPDWQSSDMRHI